jgi:UDPglucose 6-dehydrogenase
VNSSRIGSSLGKIKAALGGTFKGKTAGLLGLTFKPNTDDLRESPAIAILDGMLAAGAKVQAYDPIGMALAAQTPRDGVRYCEDEYQAAAGTDALIVATEWNQFRALDVERLRAVVNKAVIVDLRNIYEPQTMRSKGFEYSCVGRS